MKLVIASLFLILGLGLVLASGYLFWQRVNTNRLAFNRVYQQNIRQSAAKSDSLPIRITIPKQGIDVPIIPAKKHFETTDLGASYLATTPIPGEIGNSIIYGHNFGNIFAKLPLVKPGEKVVVYLNDGTKRDFTITATQEVTPDHVEILSPTKEARLTIYTCSGFLDSKRFVAVASPNQES